MLTLVLIYFLGKRMYDLAEEHQKNAWGNAIIAVLIFYAGTFIGGAIIGIILMLFTEVLIEEQSDIFWSLIALPFGLAAWYGYLAYFRKKWEKEQKEFTSELDEIGAN